MTALAVAIAFLVAAGLGATARWAVTERLNEPEAFPVGTLVVNVVGAFALGVIDGAAASTLTVAGTGLLGAFTTFSALGGEVAEFLRERRGRTALLYAGTTVVLGVGAALLGLSLS